MVRVVRTPLCIAEALRNEEPFFIGVISIPDTKPEPEKRRKKNRPEPIVIPPTKPAQPLLLGDDVEEMDW